MRVNSAHRSGRCVALVLMRRCSLVDSGGRLSSMTCATTQTTYRPGVSTASDTSHSATPIAYPPP